MSIVGYRTDADHGLGRHIQSGTAAADGGTANLHLSQLCVATSWCDRAPANASTRAGWVVLDHFSKPRTTEKYKNERQLSRNQPHLAAVLRSAAAVFPPISCAHASRSGTRATTTRAGFVLAHTDVVAEVSDPLLSKAASILTWATRSLKRCSTRLGRL